MKWAANWLSICARLTSCVAAAAMMDISPPPRKHFYWRKSDLKSAKLETRYLLDGHSPIYLIFAFTKNTKNGWFPETGLYTIRRWAKIGWREFYYLELSQTFRWTICLGICWKWNQIVVKVNFREMDLWPAWWLLSLFFYSRTIHSVHPISLKRSAEIIICKLCQLEARAP